MPDANPLWTIVFHINNYEILKLKNDTAFMWIVDPRPQHERASWDDAACNSTDNASDQYSKGAVCKVSQGCAC